MGILSSLNKGIQAVIDDMKTPESFKVGQKFEDYVRETLFIDRYYDLLERTHNYSSNNKDFAESSLKPDFTFRDKWTKKEFYVEAKFRSSLYEGKIVWCTETQLARYQKYNKQKPVFLMLGISGDAKEPERISLIPLSAAKYTGLFPSVAEKFKIEIDRPISSKILWSR